jgi:ubiquinone/menaquinone biosynthesis C-methylase UbiE
MKSNNFDGIAFIYDFLVKLFFGKTIQKAQTYFLNKIPADARVLVLGSGSGWIAEEILMRNPNSKITLVDASQKMTNKAVKKLNGEPVEIYCDDQTKVFSNPFDVVILPFFLDLFPDRSLKDVIESINKNVTKESMWIVTDFVSEKLWHRLYLWIMYRFFKVTCHIEASQLPDWQKALTSNNLVVMQENDFYLGFIKSTVYKSG